MLGNMVVEKKNYSGTGNWLDLDLIYECTPFLFIFPSLSLLPSPFLGVPSPSLSHCEYIWVTQKQKYEHTRADRKTPDTLCWRLIMISSVTLWGHCGLWHKIRVWLIHEGHFPIVHCPCRGCVTFRNTNNVLMMQYFQRAAPCHTTAGTAAFSCLPSGKSQMLN